MKSFPECERVKRDPRIVLEENKRKITFLNHNRRMIRKIKVDGCVFEKGDSTLRCDYALDPGNGVEIYVELKGSDIEHAVKQLESTITQISKDARKAKKLCFIVSSRVPSEELKDKTY
jgi:hypothetical protein